MPDPRRTAEYRRNRIIRLSAADGDLCHLCDHHGAVTCDHIIAVETWLAMFGTYDGVNNLANLAPAHGLHNGVPVRCPTCNHLCNQERGSRPLRPEPRSQRWG